MEEFQFNYSEFKNNVADTFKDLLSDEDFTNVTLVTSDEKEISAHKVILASVSPPLGRILMKNPNKHPLIFFNSIGSSVVDQLVKFIYLGECTVAEEDLLSFIEAGKSLQVKGLTDDLGQPDAEDSVENHEKKNSRDQNTLEEVAMKKYTRPTERGSKSHVQNGNVEVKEEEADITEQEKSPTGAKSKDNTTMIFKIDSIGGEDVRTGASTKLYSDIIRNSDGKFPCNQCDYEVMNRNSLIVHIKAVHERLKMSCDQCDFQTGYKLHLSDHIRTVHEGRLFECKECNFTAKNRSCLSMHTTKHKLKGSMWTTIKNRVKCSKCDFDSGSMKEMRKHIHINHM